MENPGNDSASALMGRVFAVMLGPVLLLVTAIRMFQDGGGWDTLALPYFVVLAGIILGRWLDTRGGSDFYRFSAVGVGAGVGLWVLVRVVVQFTSAA